MQLHFLTSHSDQALALHAALKLAPPPASISPTVQTLESGASAVPFPACHPEDVLITIGAPARTQRPNCHKRVTCLHWESEEIGSGSRKGDGLRDWMILHLRDLYPMIGPPAARLLDKRTPYRGRVLTLDVEQIALPDGRKTTLEMLRHPGASAVVPLTSSGEAILIRQYRHAASGSIWEIPAGKLDGAETPEECAHREVIEESGMRAGRLHRLGPMWTTPGFTDEVIHLFAATELIPAVQNLDHDELIEVHRVPWARVLELVASSELRDGKSVMAILRTDQELRAGRVSFQ